MKYTITVGKYGYELMVVKMPEGYTITEDIERDDVNELGDIWDTYCVIDEATVTVQDESGNIIYQGNPEAVADDVDGTEEYDGQTVLHEVGWRTQTYESDTMPQYIMVNFGDFSALCLDTTDMEFDSSWDGRYEEIITL